MVISYDVISARQAKHSDIVHTWIPAGQPIHTTHSRGRLEQTTSYGSLNAVRPSRFTADYSWYPSIKYTTYTSTSILYSHTCRVSFAEEQRRMLQELHECRPKNPSGENLRLAPPMLPLVNCSTSATSSQVIINPAQLCAPLEKMHGKTNWGLVILTGKSETSDRPGTDSCSTPKPSSDSNYR